MNTQPTKMSAEDALTVINNATANIQTTRQGHDLIMSALQVLGETYRSIVSNTAKPSESLHVSK